MHTAHTLKRLQISDGQAFEFLCSLLLLKCILGDFIQFCERRRKCARTLGTLIYRKILRWWLGKFFIVVAAHVCVCEAHSILGIVLLNAVVSMVSTVACIFYEQQTASTRVEEYAQENDNNVSQWDRNNQFRLFLYRRFVAVLQTNNETKQYVALVMLVVHWRNKTMQRARVVNGGWSEAERERMNDSQFNDC